MKLHIVEIENRRRLLPPAIFEGWFRGTLSSKDIKTGKHPDFDTCPPLVDSIFVFLEFLLRLNWPFSCQRPGRHPKPET
jgi:hypothetical protein